MEQIDVSAFVLVDVVLRYATVGLLMIAGTLLVRDAWSNAAARYGAGVGFTSAALLLGTPYPGFELPGIAHLVVRFLDVASIGFIWWFGLALFTDGFKLNRWHWLGMLLVVIPTAIFRAEELGYVSIDLSPLLICSAAFTLFLLTHLSWTVLKGLGDDVVETRRRMRVYFVVGLIVVTLAIVLIERIVPGSFHVELSLFRVILILPFSIWSMLWLTHLQAEKLDFLPATVIKERPKPQVPPDDEPLQHALIQSMEGDRLYRKAGLTIRQVSDHLQVPEHRLRALINKGLGYRNFSAFVNDYRIEAIKSAMADPANARIPILTLALGEGFNSLAPFNKAFRQRLGQTPTEYKERLVSTEKPDRI